MLGIKWMRRCLTISCTNKMESIKIAANPTGPRLEADEGWLRVLRCSEMLRTRASLSKLSPTGTPQTKERLCVVIWRRRYRRGRQALKATKEWKLQLLITYCLEPSIRKLDNPCKAWTSMVLGKARDSREYRPTLRSWWCNSKCSSSRRLKQRMAKKVNLPPKRRLLLKAKARSATW